MLSNLSFLEILLETRSVSANDKLVQFNARKKRKEKTIRIQSVIVKFLDLKRL